MTARIRWGRTIGAVSVFAATAAGCGSNRLIGPNTPLRIIAGDAQADTVFAMLSQALVVEVRDDAGRTMPGVTVRFAASLPLDTSRAREHTILMAPLASFNFASSASDITDSRGLAKVAIEMGSVSGPAQIIITVPTLAGQDTARFTVLPGAPAHLRVVSRDTLVFTGGTIDLLGAVTDRFGNARLLDTVTYSPGPFVSSVTPAGRVTAGTVGRGFVIARSGSMVDTTQLSVVPHGTVAIVRSVGVDTIDVSVGSMELDGSNFRRLATISGLGLFTYPEWAASGDQVVYQEVTLIVSSTPMVGHISVVDLNGKSRRLVPGSAGLERDLYGKFSKDGQWVYFSGWAAGDQHFSLFRIRPTGEDLQTVLRAGRTSSDIAWRSDPSPDGRTLVYVAAAPEQSGLPSPIRTIDVGTGTVTDLGVGGQFPRYSPDGRFIAHVEQFGRRLHIMNADGSGDRVIATGSFDEAPISFSSDGQWILITRAQGLELVRVSDGSEIPLPYDFHYSQAAFKP